MKTTKSTSSKRMSVAKRIGTATEIVRTGTRLEAERQLRKAAKAPYVTGPNGCSEYKAMLAFMEACRKHK